MATNVQMTKRSCASCSEDFAGSTLISTEHWMSWARIKIILEISSHASRSMRLLVSLKQCVYTTHTFGTFSVVPLTGARSHTREHVAELA